jgi:hypothetical protein
MATQKSDGPSKPGAKEAGWGCAAMVFLGLLLALFSGINGCSGPSVDVKSYNKVTPGMSLEEVEGLLGPGKPLAIEDVQPEAPTPGGKPWGPGTKARIWSSGDKSIVLIFQDDKVVAKMSKGL